MLQVLRVRLQETPTLLLYQQENTSVNIADPEATTYVKDWQVYLQKRQTGQVRTRMVTCQTVPKYYVDKLSQKSAVERKETGSWATQWDMHDEYERIKARARRLSKQNDGSQRRRPQAHSQVYIGDVKATKKLCFQTGSHDGGDGVSGGGGDGGSGPARGVESVGLLRALGWVERQLSSSKNIRLMHEFISGQHQVKERRKFSMSCNKASTRLLWRYDSKATKEQRVNSLTFLKTSPWLVLATHGTLSFTTQGEGLLVGWNVKKIKQPELWIRTPRPVTVVSSCPSAPQLCCVALLDGTLLVYQLDNPNPKLVLDTSGSVDKHGMPVWAVEWRDSQLMSSTATKKTLSPAGEGPPSFRRLVLDLQSPQLSGSEIAYVLVSSSEDGTVKEWIFVRGSLLCCTTLLNVRLPLWLSIKISGGIETLLEARQGGQGLGGLPIPQKVPATSMHFRPGDKTTYLVGTASGEVLLCRTFERDRVGGVYAGHTAQVTRVEWRFAGEEANSIFLSAALDDSIRVWYIDKPVPIAVLRLVEEVAGGYVDACWCPWYGNLIAGVHGAGLHLWDISLSTHTPIISRYVSGATCVAFSPHTRNVMVGDKDGQVSVFHLEGLELSASVFLRYSTKISKLAKIGVIPVESKE
ncbi:dynein axonemal intermediate chain 4-like isoform X4 [Eriocheir sinensis]|uniref:dynein axonemal intermediate chain 4-like isoform X1 n=1 Tax=Eriocheir sinensis TaxID=95602 RepID=UPI0021C9CE41|nr:dynein axonemal intermediate chain 4-like isoform X1 [Eriocheir sinensis]XP_050739150.1 dynein axonemal intermediate chain 4-like isoform X2 [Eriocheir sinensis]XP_050739151.1 dynein axonemal intermediate chain 4-like isoform X3 [Eriocheir sinensis]XP_050739152.1 dynein axonemal intermediate chain 4-like isoform X4 [Eriocheir sinensis]